MENTGINIKSWMLGICKECGYNVIGTQPDSKEADVWWYCSNKKCIHHEGDQTYDQDEPEWINF